MYVGMQFSNCCMVISFSDNEFLYIKGGRLDLQWILNAIYMIMMHRHI